jgi:hypothetical protein
VVFFACKPDFRPSVTDNTFGSGQILFPTTTERFVWVALVYRFCKKWILLWLGRSPDELKVEFARFVEYCKSKRYHEVPSGVTSDDVHLGRGKGIQRRRAWLRVKTPARLRENDIKILRASEAGSVVQLFALRFLLAQTTDIGKNL